jgi:hypothetical protein
MSRLAATFRERNPGYDLRYERRVQHLAATEFPRVVFVQSGETQAKAAETSSDVTVGDIVLLRPGQAVTCDQPIDALVFDVPDPLPAETPTFVRPDWDPKITDQPGGCATETGAYRRILLTWQEKNGPYIYHALNAHRVRITDSFTHYHPIEGGFDEFYLVQMTQPKARLVTSTKTDRVIHPDSIAADDADDLLESHELAVGDLVYLPRGVIHRGLGGVLAQVITVPGFKPGAEIGVDHHLAKINQRLALSGDAALPLNQEASTREVIR